MATLLQDIGSFLVTNGVVVAEGTDFFRDFMPDTPDNVVVVYEYVGSPALNYEEAVHRSVQVKVRNADPDTARMIALTIFTLLSAENRIVHFTDTRWGQVYLRQPPYKLDRDNGGRTTYGFNAGITTTKE